MIFTRINILPWSSITTTTTVSNAVENIVQCRIFNDFSQLTQQSKNRTAHSYNYFMKDLFSYLMEKFDITVVLFNTTSNRACCLH